MTKNVIPHITSAFSMVTTELMRGSRILMLISKILMVRIFVMSIRILVISLIMVTSLEMLPETTILVWIS